VSGSLDTTIRVWDLSRGSEEEIGTFKGHTQGMICVVVVIVFVVSFTQPG
jgi:WD40 repeat protein